MLSPAELILFSGTDLSSEREADTLYLPAMATGDVAPPRDYPQLFMCPAPLPGRHTPGDTSSPACSRQRPKAPGPMLRPGSSPPLPLIKGPGPNAILPIPQPFISSILSSMRSACSLVSVPSATFPSILSVTPASIAS